MNWFRIYETMATGMISPTQSTSSRSRVRCPPHTTAVQCSNRDLGDDEYDYYKAEAGREMKKRLGLGQNPLDDATGRVR